MAFASSGTSVVLSLLVLDRILFEQTVREPVLTSALFKTPIGAPGHVVVLGMRAVLEVGQDRDRLAVAQAEHEVRLVDVIARVADQRERDARDHLVAQRVDERVDARELEDLTVVLEGLGIPRSLANWWVTSLSRLREAARRS